MTLLKKSAPQVFLYQFLQRFFRNRFSQKHLDLTASNPRREWIYDESSNKYNLEIKELLRLTINPSHHDPGQREKINLKFLFLHFFVVP